MPRSRRRRRTLRQQGPTDSLIFLGGVPMTGDPIFSDEELRQFWPAWRRAVWAETVVGDVPWAAEQFDGLRANGCGELGARLRAEEFTADDLDAVLDALAEDRRALTRFRKRDPAGAEAIHDYLSMLEERFAQVEEIARQAVGAPCQVRHALLAYVHSNQMYGERVEGGGHTR
jgi:hypothetical protein